MPKQKPEPDPNFDDVLTLPESELKQHQSKKRKHDIRERIDELKIELEKRKTDLENARSNKGETNSIYKAIQNMEQEISRLHDKLFEFSNKHNGKTEIEINVEKAALLSRQGVVNIRPPLVAYIGKND